jgi:predicted DNA-binding antitoxin AbrB/MazE fold protein
VKEIQAIFENGVFRPIEPVDLPEGSKVGLRPRLVSEPTPERHRARVHELLSRRVNTGERNLAETHDEPPR